MKKEEIQAVHKLLKDNPLREDEFILFSTPVLEIDKHGFKSYYNAKKETIPPTMNIMVSSSTPIETLAEDSANISLWLEDKQLGIIADEQSFLIDELARNNKLSRVLIIENPQSVPSYYDTYMKAVVIITNAEAISAEYIGGRFISLRPLSPDEATALDEEAGYFG